MVYRYVPLLRYETMKLELNVTKTIARKANIIQKQYKQLLEKDIAKLVESLYDMIVRDATADYVTKRISAEEFAKKLATRLLKNFNTQKKLHRIIHWI